MFCKNCGRQLPDNAAFCPGCGAKRPDGEAYADERSSADIRNLPNYAKEIDRSGHAVDSDRKKFSLSDPDRKKFSLSDSGREKFSLSDKSRKDDGGGIVRLTANREPAPPPKEPTGFVNPLKDSGKTVFHDNETAAGTSTSAPHAAEPAGQGPSAAQENTAASPEPPVQVEAVVVENGEEPTGFVNPLPASGQDIRLGSDGDRNEANSGKFSGDPSEIDSHMGFAIFCTFCCCLPTGIAAIVFASQVSKHLQDGDYEAAKKSADNAQLFCWISVGLGLLCNVGSSIFSAVSEVLGTTP